MFGLDGTAFGTPVSGLRTSGLRFGAPWPILRWRPAKITSGVPLGPAALWHDPFRPGFVLRHDGRRVVTRGPEGRVLKAVRYVGSWMRLFGFVVELPRLLAAIAVLEFQSLYEHWAGPPVDEYCWTRRNVTQEELFHCSEPWFYIVSRSSVAFKTQPLKAVV